MTPSPKLKRGRKTINQISNNSIKEKVENRHIGHRTSKRKQKANGKIASIIDQSTSDRPHVSGGGYATADTPTPVSQHISKKKKKSLNSNTENGE